MLSPPTSTAVTSISLELLMHLILNLKCKFVDNFMKLKQLRSISFVSMCYLQYVSSMTLTLYHTNTKLSRTAWHGANSLAHKESLGWRWNQEKSSRQEKVLHCIRENVTWHAKCQKVCFLKYKVGLDWLRRQLLPTTSGCNYIVLVVCANNNEGRTLLYHISYVFHY